MRVDLLSMFVVSLVVGALACRDTSVASAPIPDASASAYASAAASATVAVLTVPEAGPPLDASSARDAATVDSGKKVVVAPQPSASGFGKHNDVCAYGGRSGPHFETPPPCGPGLFCCYPCGIDGCDSVCHTEAECNADRTRP